MPDWMVIGGAVLGVVVLVYLAQLAWDRDRKSAARKTRRRAKGALTGAAGVGVSAATVGIEVLAQLPEIALTALGVWAIISGISWEAFAAMALLVYLAAETINGVPR